MFDMTLDMLVDVSSKGWSTVDVDDDVLSAFFTSVIGKTSGYDLICW